MLGISDEEFLEIANKIPPWPEGMSLLRDVLRLSAKSKSLFFCLEDLVVLQYGSHISLSDSPLNNGRTGQRIQGKNEVIDPSANLDATNLRDMFVTLEALVFKCVHLRLEAQCDGYVERTETYETRLDRLKTEGFIDDKTKQLALEIYHVRCQFAHSLRSVENIEYLSRSLEDRWGSSNTSQPIRLKRKFLPDMYRLSEALLSVFKPVQKDQLDSITFKIALEEIRSW